MADPTQFEGWAVAGSEKIRKDTSTAGIGSKRDAYADDTASGGLASNQHIVTNIVPYTQHLPYSPAGGAPVHEGEFGAGHRWTEADGKVQEGSGPSDLGW